MDKVDTTAWTPGGYIDAMTREGRTLYVVGKDPANRAWLYIGEPDRENTPALSPELAAYVRKWRAMYDIAYPLSAASVARELYRRGLWHAYDLWAEGDPLEAGAPVRGIDISGIEGVRPLEAPLTERLS